MGVVVHPACQGEAEVRKWEEEAVVAGVEDEEVDEEEAGEEFASDDDGDDDFGGDAMDYGETAKDGEDDDEDVEVLSGAEDDDDDAELQPAAPPMKGIGLGRAASGAI